MLALHVAVCHGSVATPVSCLQSRPEYLVCIQIAAKLCLNLALSLWAKVAHNLPIIIAFVLCTNLEVLSTLRLSRNGHSLPPFPPSLGFSLTPPYPNTQKCLAFSEHLTLSVTVQATNERILQRSCCEKLMITPTWYTFPTPLPPANT